MATLQSGSSIGLNLVFTSDTRTSANASMNSLCEVKTNVNIIIRLIRHMSTIYIGYNTPFSFGRRVVLPLLFVRRRK